MVDNDNCKTCIMDPDTHDYNGLYKIWPEVVLVVFTGEVGSENTYRGSNDICKVESTS